MTSNHPTVSHRAFVVAQVGFLSIAAFVVGAASSKGRPDGFRPPLLREKPIKIRPRNDIPQIVTDDQLLSVLKKLRLPKSTVKINHIDHGLRFWGVDARFSTEFLSGSMLRRVLVDDQVMRDICGLGSRPLLQPTKTGVRFRTQQGKFSSSHADHSLASLAEVGTPLSFPVQLREGSANVRELVEHALRSFSLNQPEYEWSAIVLALYGTNQPWVSSEGQQITFDRLVDRITRQQFGQGCCYGNHRLYTLAIILRVDETQSILSESARQKALLHLTSATSLLVSAQSTEGFWGNDWPGPPTLKEDKLSIRSQRLMATGHALEWWAIAPEVVLPAREVLVRAGQWLVREIEQLDPQAVTDNYTILTHAGSALSLWRGGIAGELYNRLER